MRTLIANDAAPDTVDMTLDTVDMTLDTVDMTLDTVDMTMVGERAVVEGDRILEVAETASSEPVDRVIDLVTKHHLDLGARGRYVLPWFIDAHVHHVITTMAFPRLMRLSGSNWPWAWPGWPKRRSSGTSPRCATPEEASPG